MATENDSPTRQATAQSTVHRERMSDNLVSDSPEFTLSILLQWNRSDYGTNSLLIKGGTTTLLVVYLTMSELQWCCWSFTAKAQSIC